MSEDTKTPNHEQNGRPVVSVGVDDDVDTSFVSVLIEQNEQLTLKLQECTKEENGKKARVEQLRIQMEAMQLKLDQLELESAKIEQTTAATVGDRTAEEIQSLLATYDRLKADEKEFKEMCNVELERLQALAAAQADDTTANPGDIEAQYQRAQSRLEVGKSELGAINRKLALLKRQIDQVPNRIELREYRLRFAELYNQVSATHRHTKQFFSLYNSLEDTKRYLEKELSLLNSIIDSYHQISQSGSGRVEFLNQLSSLHDGMKDTCNKVDKRHQNERHGLDKLQHELQRLLDQKVSYEKCLKELESECKNNDKLLATLKAKEAAIAHQQ